MTKGSHIPVLDYLRGLAALSVCLFHFTNGNAELLAGSDPLKLIGSAGWLGVEAFFVISGFVIPYSLFLRSYGLSDAMDFFIRRLKRLEPPYLACILLVVTLQLLSSVTPGFRGKPFVFDVPQLLAHFGYLNAVLNYGWLNPVFWTLAIEFQFYIFIAITYPLLSHTNKGISTTAVVIMATLGLLGSGRSSLLLQWLPLFSIGVAACQFYVGRIKTNQFLVLFCVTVCLTFTAIGIREALVGALVAGTILFVGPKPMPSTLAPLAFAGTLSYSLYLLHVPVGGRIINLATRLPDNWVLRYAVIGLAFLVSLIAAYVFWRLVEKPSQAWSKKSNKSRLAHVQPVAMPELLHIPKTDSQ